MTRQTYTYQNENGADVVRVVRTPDKQFYQYRLDPITDMWVAGLKGIKPPLYRLPEILRVRHGEETILFLEGEKDVDKARSLGFKATCNAMGAGCFRADHAPYFKDHNVLMIADNDEAGWKHVRSVGNLIHKEAKQVRYIKALPGFEEIEGADFYDWAEANTELDYDEMFRVLSLASELFVPDPPKPKVTRSKASNAISQLGGTKIERLKEIYRVEDIADRLTTLFVTGDKLHGKCPLHDEQKGFAFVVDIEQQKWWCYGKCSVWGDSVDLVAECISRGITGWELPVS